MLIQSGLYYPYIHIRDARWLKVAALYWKRVDRIVPIGYPTRDSVTTRTLQDELGFIENRRPGQAAVDTSRFFIDLIEERGRDLVDRLRIQPSSIALARQHGRPVDAGINANGSIGYIYAEKLSERLIEIMWEQGLAFGVGDEAGGHGRYSMEASSAHWIGMDSRLAATYMTVLARLTARHFDLNPVTNVPLVHVAMDGLSVDSIADTLLNQSTAHTDSDLRVALQQRVAVLAVETVLPRSISLVNASEIVAFRKAHEDELGAFQAAVAAAASDLSFLPVDINASALRNRVIEVTQEYLVKPREELEKSLRIFGLETIKSVMTIQTPVSAGAGALVGAATAPLIGSAVGAAFITGSFAVGELSRRRDLRNRATAANYLLELRSSLTPKEALRRRLRLTSG